MSYTFTITAPTFTIHATPRGLGDVLRDIRESAIFTPEEQGALAAAIPHLAAHPVYALTYVTIYVVRRAMLRIPRDDDAGGAWLVRREGELFQFLQPYLPLGTSAEEFVSDRARFQELSLRYTAIQAPLTAAQTRARDQGNAAINSIGESMRSTARSLHGRIQALSLAEEMTTRIYQEAEAALQEHGNLLNEGSTASDALIREHEVQQNVLRDAKDVLRRINP